MGRFKFKDAVSESNPWRPTRIKALFTQHTQNASWPATS